MLLHSSLDLSGEVTDFVNDILGLSPLSAQAKDDLFLDKGTSFSSNSSPKVGVVLFVVGVLHVNGGDGDVSSQDNSSDRPDTLFNLVGRVND